MNTDFFTRIIGTEKISSQGRAAPRSGRQNKPVADAELQKRPSRNSSIINEIMAVRVLKLLVTEPKTVLELATIIRPNHEADYEAALTLLLSEMARKGLVESQNVLSGGVLKRPAFLISQAGLDVVRQFERNAKAKRPKEIE